MSHVQDGLGTGGVISVSKLVRESIWFGVAGSGFVSDREIESPKGKSPTSLERVQLLGSLDV